MRPLTVCVAISVLALAACQNSRLPVDTRPFVQPVARETHPPPPDHALAWDALCRVHNARVAQLRQGFATLGVRASWRQENGSTRSERGDGRLAWRLPSDCLLTLEGPTQTYLHIGSGWRDGAAGPEAAWWLFDLASDERTAWVGDMCAGGPWGIPPQRLSMLLGLGMLDPATPGRISWYEPGIGPPGYLVETPGLRMLLAPESLRPRRVDITDSNGWSLAIAELEGLVFPQAGAAFDPETGASLPTTVLPPIPARISLFPCDGSARLDLQVHQASADPSRQRDAWYRFEALVRQHQPRRIEDGTHSR